MNRKDNARSRDTDRRIVTAFYQLLDRYGTMSKVTVREICQEAGINRSTFYAHYVDTYDLLEKVERNMEREMTRAFLEQVRPGSDVVRGFVSMFKFIAEYRRFFEIYLSEAAHPVLGISRELYQSRFDSADLMALGFESEEEIGYQEDFFLAGITAVVRRWLKSGCKQSPEELMDMIGRQYNVDHSLFDWSDDAKWDD